MGWNWSLLIHRARNRINHLNRDYWQAEALRDESTQHYDIHAQDQLGYYNLGVALTRMQQSKRALAALQKAAQLHWEWHNQALYPEIQRVQILQNE